MSYVASEFVWGIVIGIALSALTAVVSQILQRKHQKKILVRFTLDIITNISELNEQLDDIRKKNAFIDRDFLDLIEVEVNIFGRNREHITALTEDSLRRDVRDFVTRVITRTVRARSRLDEFYRQMASVPEEDRRDPTKIPVDAKQALSEANNACDDLRDQISNKAHKLIDRLKRA